MIKHFFFFFYGGAAGVRSQERQIENQGEKLGRAWFKDIYFYCQWYIQTVFWVLLPYLTISHIPPRSVMHWFARFEKIKTRVHCHFTVYTIHVQLNSQTNLFTRHVFPTPLSPTMIDLATFSLLVVKRKKKKKPFNTIIAVWICCSCIEILITFYD